MFGSFGPWELGLILLVLPLYLTPTIVAAVRKSKNITGIVLLNILAGWTFFGWVGALVWAIVSDKHNSKGSYA